MCAALDTIVRFIAIPRNRPPLGKGAASVLGILGDILDLDHFGQSTPPRTHSNRKHSLHLVVVSGFGQPYCRDPMSLFHVAQVLLASVPMPHICIKSSGSTLVYGRAPFHHV
jgi:hypothetical protein